MTARGGEARPADARRALEAGRIPPVWLWAGPEEFLKDELWSRLVAKVIPAGLESMNVSRHRGSDDEAALVVSACRTLPMMAERRAVLFRDIDKLGKAEEEILAAYAADPSPETVLVLGSPKLPGDGRNRRLAEAGASPVVFWTLFERDAVEWIRQRFQDLGKRCDAAAAGELLAACGAGPGQEKVALADIAPEVEKVSLAMGPRAQVTAADVTGIGRRIDETLRDEVVSALGMGNAVAALRALDGLLLHKEWDEVRLLANVTHRVLALSRVRELLDAGTASRDLASRAAIWPKQVEEIERAARGWDSGGLRRSLEILARADRALKSTGKPPRIVLERALLEIVAERAAAR